MKIPAQLNNTSQSGSCVNINFVFKNLVIGYTVDLKSMVNGWIFQYPGDV